MSEPDPVLTLVRWVLTTLLAFFWLYVAAFNGHAAWLACVRRRRGPSIAPLLGGAVAWVAYLLCPLEPERKFLPLLAALVLDAGSLPYLVLFVPVLWRERAMLAADLRARAREPRSLWLWLSFAGWVALIAWLVPLAQWARLGARGFLWMFLSTTVAYWAFCALWLSRRARRGR